MASKVFYTHVNYQPRIQSLFPTATIEAMYGPIMKVAIVSDMEVVLPPDIPEYIPLKINRSEFTSLSFSNDEKDIDQAIVTYLSDIECTDITVTHTDETVILDFWHKDASIWVNPMDMRDYLEALSFSSRYSSTMQLLTSNYLMDVFMLYQHRLGTDTLLSNIIKKVPHCEVWLIDTDQSDTKQLITEALTQLQQDGWFAYDKTTPEICSLQVCEVFNLSLLDFEGKNLEELVPILTPSSMLSAILDRAETEIKKIEKKDDIPYDYTSEYIYIQGNGYVNSSNWSNVMQEVSCGRIPVISFFLDMEATDVSQLYHMLIVAYSKINAITDLRLIFRVFDSILLLGNVVTLLMDSMKTLMAFSSHFADPQQVKFKYFTDMDEAIVFRARLSRLQIRSLCHTFSPSSFAVTWVSDYPLEQIEAIDLDVQKVQKLLADYIKSQCREDFDPVSRTKFDDLTPKELVEVVITPSGYGYELSTYKQMIGKTDPMTRSPLVFKEQVKLFHGATGYFTVGPILGLYDTIPVPVVVKLTDGMITNTVQEVNEKTLATFQVSYFNYALEGAIIQNLLRIWLTPEQIPTVQDELLTLWRYGFFLLDWDKMYTLDTGRLSALNLFIPPNFIVAVEDEASSEACLKYIDAVVSLYS